ncbi:MAG: hypothetical protein LQ342_005798 [Letrouitia transgressa]|nr:MAG: hypothetical protein LQ342_005798 [Letrouitia transgressa]
MHTKASTTPLTLNTKTTSNAKSPVFGTATFQYTEEPTSRKGALSDFTQSQQLGYDDTPSRKRSDSQVVGMSINHAGSAVPSPALYVRALYDYEADDRTSLSFRQGDTIQVITQLASGWWDGIIHGVRGWFPSNYCAVVTGPEEGALRASQVVADGGESFGESEPDDNYEDYDGDLNANGASRQNGSRGRDEEAEGIEQEEAAFWIPQVTPAGRLFYFNTLTGVSTMELPLETPTSDNETGPRNRMNIHVPEQTRPPPELMAGGLQHDEEDSEDVESASETGGDSSMTASRTSQPRKRRSDISDGMSPSGSLDSNDPLPRSHGEPSDSSMQNGHMSTSQLISAAMPPSASNTTSYTGNSLNQLSPAIISRSFFDDGNTVIPTWNRLVESMRKSVEAYRQAINNADRAEYVRKAEDISDHLRMLLAAASGTTDNHSGNPSIISTNKALYPHFRDMMSRFSKLVLSSHIAAADWPASDSYSKCLQEAEGVLHGVYSYVEVARSQRGEEIPRLIPGFIQGSSNGGNWQSNNLGQRDPIPSTSFVDQDEYEALVEPSVKLDASLLEKLDGMKRIIVASIRRLEEHLVITDKLITASRHGKIGNGVCAAAGKVIDYFRPWMSTIESIDLSSLGSPFQNPQMVDFGCQKQRLYDLVMQLMMTCQAVAAPLCDEWADARGDPLEDRLTDVGKVLRQLETCASQVYFSLQLLLDAMARDASTQQLRDAQIDEGYRRGQTHSNYQPSHQPSSSRQERTYYPDNVYMEGLDPMLEHPSRRDRSKVEKFFGEVPAPMMPGRESEETPAFLTLDHEAEISYDTKIDPPQLRGGTLTALVEQLTRHDRLDSDFNNTFLLTYRSFTSATELFELLVKRFSIQPPRGISEDDYKTWVDKKQKPIRFRVVNILKSWFDHYWMENNDRASNELLRRVYSFAKDSIATTQTPGSVPLMTTIEQRLRGQDTNQKILIPNHNTPIPAPIMPRNMKKLKFLDIDVTEFARQLTIIESRLYGKIKPTECLSKTWQRKVAPDEPEPAANVKALILHSNQLTNWVAEMILTQGDVKKRVVVIKHFVAIADVSGRVYLTDLTFIEDGIPSVIKKNHYINFAKRAKTAEVIRDIQRNQNVPYPLKPVADLQDYILSNMQSAGDVHEMYEKSLQVEPREREDEKITRYASFS